MKRILLTVTLLVAVLALFEVVFTARAGPQNDQRQALALTPAVMTPAVQRDIAESNRFDADRLTLDQRLDKLDRALGRSEAYTLVRRGELQSDYLTADELADRYGGSLFARTLSRRGWHAGK